jgi:hypothetical protein
MKKERRIVTTPHGDIRVVRHNTIAITLVRTRRSIRYHNINYEAKAVAHIEHQKIPKSLLVVKSNCAGWGDPIATYDLRGCEIHLKG